ncbi:GtrA family protein [Falsiroseomonas sp.]|jgi:putative flippase GtrA|uniref:GtrA family protein n=1 Tax=Falsiroseomonas sp. TaxID=2870721 RepID=UPI003F70122D
MPEFLRFLLTGGVAALANMGSRYVLQPLMAFELAVAIAYLIGMVTAFLLARRFVFGASGGRVEGEFLRFAAVNAVSFAVVWLVSVGLARLVFPAMGFTWHAETVAHVIGVLSPVALSFRGHKSFTFRRRGTR